MTTKSDLYSVLESLCNDMANRFFHKTIYECNLDWRKRIYYTQRLVFLKKHEHKNLATAATYYAEFKQQFLYGVSYKTKCSIQIIQKAYLDVVSDGSYPNQQQAEQIKKILERHINHAKYLKQIEEVAEDRERMQIVEAERQKQQQINDELEALRQQNEELRRQIEAKTDTAYQEWKAAYINS